jgi:hypothetical protein
MTVSDAQVATLRAFLEGNKPGYNELLAQLGRQAADAVDPRVAERLIREVLGEGSTDDIDSRTSSTTKLFLLAALTADADLSSGELNEFMTKVRKMAEHLAG